MQPLALLPERKKTNEGGEGPDSKSLHNVSAGSIISAL
jgi:hypothetical protein